MSKILQWTHGVNIEGKAIRQLENVANMPFVKPYVAVMPDVHWGMGATIGSVIPTIGAIIPAAVGVDIGCGMIAQKINLTANDLPDNLFELRFEIEAAVPHGRTDNGGINDKGAFREPTNGALIAMHCFLKKDLDKITARNIPESLIKQANRCPRHLGTLGTGNHFLELCLDEEKNVWVMIHSGSRGIGNSLGNYFINEAKKDMKRWFINLPDEDLAYIPDGSELFKEYWFALNWAQKFAYFNRLLILQKTMEVLSNFFKKPLEYCEETAINCHHNYADKETHKAHDVIITRKGAIRITKDTLGIIPGSMGAKSFIVKGKESKALADSFNSCSHGAGRSMSRTEAKEMFTIHDHEKATQGVECRKDIDVIDETPGAYKDIDAVMRAQEDHVEIVHTLKQVLCIKG